MKPFERINVYLINIKSITFMKKTLVLILFIMLTAGTSFSQESYDLNKTVRTALNNSLTISTFNNNISIQELNLKSSYGDLIPSLSFSGQWSKSNTYSKGGIIYQNGLPISTTMRICWPRRHSASRGSTWWCRRGTWLRSCGSRDCWRRWILHRPSWLRS